MTQGGAPVGRLPWAIESRPIRAEDNEPACFRDKSVRVRLCAGGTQALSGTD
jgi:hypothetical protein